MLPLHILLGTIEFEIFSNNMNTLYWNASNWLQDFQEASEHKDKSALRELRIAVFEHTVKCVASNGYLSPSGAYVSLGNSEKMMRGTCFYRQALPPVERMCTYDTEIKVLNEDTLVTAKILLDEGLRPAVLNMASRRNPGGGVTTGSGAQEENLFRRTNLFRSLYQFAIYASKYGLKKSPCQYPLDRNWGGIYTPGATVFKGAESEGYPLLEDPFEVDFIAVPAVNRPELDGEGMIVPYLAEATKNKMRTLFRIALVHGNDSLVLGALGCGAFRNPPEHIAQIFHQVLEEDEFKDRFKKIFFAILDDHNTGHKHNPDGNYLPFVKEFAGSDI